jgi:hypothetical protein
VRFYGELVQVDIAYMFTHNDFKYFVLIVDCFSFKLFVKPLKSKDSPAVCDALQLLFKEFSSPISVFQTDRGKEFEGECKKLYSKLKIVHKTKVGKNKANFAENAIRLVKRKLYMLLRNKLTHNWTDYIVQIVEQFNDTPREKLGWLTPNSINSEFDSLKVEELRRQDNIKVFESPSFTQQQKNEAHFKGPFKIGDYVYLNFPETLFDKGFDTQRGQIFQIKKISAGILPELYSLKDLMNDDYPGFYYRQQLVKAPDPNFKRDFFAIEKILKTKYVNKEKYFLVKYLYYPNKFNQLIPAKNLKTSKAQ